MKRDADACIQDQLAVVAAHGAADALEQALGDAAGFMRRGQLAEQGDELGTAPARELALRTIGLAARCAGVRDHPGETLRDLYEHGVTGFTAGSLAVHIMAVVQGAFVLAKAVDGPDGAVETLRHLRRYIAMLFREKAP